MSRGSLTLWVDETAVKAWYYHEHHGGRGSGSSYSNVAIETPLMNVPLTSPDYTSISKSAKTVNVQYRNPGRGPIAYVAVDATGLKVFGEGEWKTRKHGSEKRRTWRKLHLAIDASTHEVVASEVSLVSVGDNEVLPTLLNPLRRKIMQVSADGAYDTKGCYQLLRLKGCKATIPPRSNAGLWEKGHPRNEAVEALKAGQLK